VSVIIPAFNAGATIARAIKSALAQEYVEEVIVCDDGSQDETSKISSMQDDGTGRLSVIKLTENKGPAAARNAGLAASRSPCICLLDSDDYFLPGRIALLLHADIGEWDMLADDIIIVPESVESGRLALAGMETPQTSMLLDLAPFVMANISQPGRPRGEWGFVKPLVKRAFLDKHDLKYDEKLRLAEDYALYVRAMMAGARFRLVSACGYVAVERDSSLSSQHSAADLRNVVDFDARCLEGGTKLSAAEREALAAHRRAAQHKCDHRFLLDTKKERGMLSALAASIQVSGSWLYILVETFRAKANAFASLFRHPRKDHGSARFLIGAPLTTTVETP
jgi:succinoglycan biosynthesis protein ExoU